MTGKLPTVMVDTSVLVTSLQQQKNNDFQNADYFPHLLVKQFIKTDYYSKLSMCLKALDPDIVSTKEGQQAARQQPLIRQLIWELHSPTTLRHIASLTNTQALLPDPFLVGVGLESWTNSLLKPMFVRHPKTGLLALIRVEIMLGLMSDAFARICIPETEVNNCEKLKAEQGQIFLSTVDGFSASRSVENSSVWSLVAYLYINDRARPLDERQKAFEDY